MSHIWRTGQRGFSGYHGRSRWSRETRGSDNCGFEPLHFLCKLKEAKLMCSNSPCASCWKARAWYVIWVGWGWSQRLLVWFLGCSLQTPHLQVAQNQTCAALWTVSSPAGTRTDMHLHHRQRWSQIFSGCFLWYVWVQLCDNYKIYRYLHFKLNT